MCDENTARHGNAGGLVDRGLRIADRNVGVLPELPNPHSAVRSRRYVTTALVPSNFRHSSRSRISSIAATARSSSSSLV